MTEGGQGSPESQSNQETSTDKSEKFLQTWKDRLRRNVFGLGALAMITEAGVATYFATKGQYVPTIVIGAGMALSALAVGVKGRDLIILEEQTKANPPSMPENKTG